MSGKAAGAVCGVVILKIAVIAFVIYWCKKRTKVSLVKEMKPRVRRREPKREEREHEYEYDDDRHRQVERDLHEVRTLRDPSQIVVGSSDCPIPKLLQSLQKAASFPIFNEKWSEFARIMGVPSESIKSTRHDLLTAKIILSDAMYWIIENWVGRMGRAGTLKAFLEILEESSMIDCADSVREDFQLEN